MTRVSIALFVFASVVPTVSAQGTWTQQNPATTPPGRAQHVLAYDFFRRRIVMFSGAMSPPASDTWEYDGVDWTMRVTANRPGARSAAAFAYDPVRRRVVLFGGSSGSAETWEYDGTDWTKLSPQTSPPARWSCQMAYDTVGQRMVLFGGYDGRLFGDTWSFDGATWTQLNPASTPSPRCCFGMTTDAGRGVIVLFGGASGVSSGDLADTWEWDGGNWRLRPSAAAPLPRRGTSMAYDFVRGRSVLFGGGVGRSTSPVYGDTWEWDGVTWTAMTTAGPAGRNTAVAYDAARDRTVLFGGYSTMVFSDTWEYRPGAAISGTGSGRLGTALSFALNAGPDAGLGYQAGSSFGAGPVPIDRRSLGLSIDSLLVLSAGGLVPTVFGGYRGTLDANGRAAASLTILSSSSLIGVKIHTAFVTLLATAPSGIKSISNTHAFTIIP